MRKVNGTEAPAMHLSNKVGKDGKRQIRKQNAGQSHAQEVVDTQHRYPHNNAKPVVQPLPQAGREIAQNPSAVRLNNIAGEIEKAKGELQKLTETLSDRATSNVSLGNIAPEASNEIKIAKKYRRGTAKTGFKYFVEDSKGNVYELANKNEYNQVKKGKMFNITGAKPVNVTPAVPTIEPASPAVEPKAPAAEPAAQTPKASEPAGQKKLTRGDKVRANNLWTTRVRPNLEAQLTSNPLTQSVLPNKDFSGRNFLDEANQAAAASKPASQPANSSIYSSRDGNEYARMLEEQKGNVTPQAPAAEPELTFEADKKVKPSRQERLREITNNPEKRARYNKLKLSQNPELKARYDRIAHFKKMNGLKKAGKCGLFLTVAGIVGKFLLDKCSGDDKKATPVKDETKPEKTKPTPAQPEKHEQPETPVAPTTPEEPVAPTQPAPSDETPVDVIGNIIQNGDSLEEVANRYGVTVEQLKELNSDKIKQFKTANGELIEGFKVGEDITLPEGTQKVDGLRTKDEAISDYEKQLIENFDNIPQVMWNQDCTPEFRKKHKIGEYKEAA